MKHTIKDEWLVIDLTRNHCRRQIAELTGLPVSTIGDIQRKYHLVLSFGKQHTHQFRAMPDEHLWGRILEELYSRQRMSLDAVAAYLHMDRGTVRRRLVSLGFNIRPQAETRRGKKYPRPNYLAHLPSCPCGAKIKAPGERYCSACRHRPNRLKHLTA